MLLDDSEMITDALLFCDISSLVYLSGGLRRSVIAYRPLHWGTTSKAKVMAPESNLITLSSQENEFNCLFIPLSSEDYH